MDTLWIIHIFREQMAYLPRQSSHVNGVDGSDCRHPELFPTFVRDEE